MNEQEQKISNILNSYDKQNPSYPFNYVFYNLAQNRTRPIDFPIEKWDEAVLKAPSPNHMPVILRGFDELEIRVKKQFEISNNMNDSNEYIDNRIKDIKVRIISLNSSINELINKCRQIKKIDFYCENSDEIIEKIYKIKQQMKKSRKCAHFENKEDMIKIMWNFKMIGERLKKDVKNEINKK